MGWNRPGRATPVLHAGLREPRPAAEMQARMEKQMPVPKNYFTLGLGSFFFQKGPGTRVEGKLVHIE